MIQEGLIDEAYSLFSKKHLNALNTVGYKELFHHFEFKSSIEETTEKIKSNTKKYAKRQITWFKKDSEYFWVENENLDIAKNQIINHVESSTF